MTRFASSRLPRSQDKLRKRDIYLFILRMYFKIRLSVYLGEKKKLSSQLGKYQTAKHANILQTIVIRNSWRVVTLPTVDVFQTQSSLSNNTWKLMRFTKHYIC